MTALPRRPLFAGGPEVARLCLGTMMFGDVTDAAEADRVLGAYLEAGGNFIDTADVYAAGASEAMLGALLGPRREGVVLATKAGYPMRGIPGSGGLSPRWLAAAAEGSLRRLATDRIDLFWLHADDETTPLEEVVGALDRLVAAGKVRHWGVSNFRAWKIAELVRLADAAGAPRPVAAQPLYHLLNRTAETELLPACAHFGIGVVSYSPLARGVLTGKYRAGTPPGSRAGRGDRRILETEFQPGTLAAAARAAAYAEATGRSPAALALSWVLANPLVAGVVAGPRDAAQMADYIAALGCPWGPGDEAALSALCAPGQTAAPGHTDPRYPVWGRPVPAAGWRGRRAPRPGPAAAPSAAGAAPSPASRSP